MARRDLGGIAFGLVVLLVGGYFVLRDTLGVSLPDVNWDQIWPVLLLVLGVAIVLGAWNRSAPNHR